MRTMYDAITPANIPKDAQMVAGYIDGRYAWREADWARFPRAVKVQIAVFSTTAGGHVLDVEPGCASPVSAPAWVRRRRAVGVDPTVYCSLSDWSRVRDAFKAAGVPEPHWWIAAYPGSGASLYPGSVAHQYANPGPVDISVVADYWPGVDPAPKVTVAPSHPQAAPTLGATPPDPSWEDTVMKDLIIACFTQLLGRPPKDTTEVDYWLVRAAQGGWTAKQLAVTIGATPEAKAHAGKK